MIDVIKKNLVMLKYIYKYCPSFLFVSVIQSILLNVGAILSIFFTKFIVDSMSHSIPFIQIIGMAVGIFSIQMVMGCISVWLSEYIVPRNTELLKQGMLKELFAQSVKIDVECYENTKFYADFTMAINQSDKRALDVLKTFSSFVGALFGAASFSVVISVMDPYLFVAVALSVCANMFFSFRNSKVRHRYYEKQVDISREQGYVRRVFYLNEYAKELRLFSELPQLITSMYDNAVKKVLLLIKKYAKKFVGLLMAQSFITNVVSLGVTLYIVYRVLQGELKVSDYFVLVSSMGQLVSEITKFFEIIPQLYAHSLYVENYLNFMDYVPRVGDARNATSMNDEQEITLKNVSFTYPGSTRESLHNVNLEIQRGEKVAFVGPNGSGKSTLLKVITRLYDVNKGEVLIGGIDIKQYHLDSLRKHIGVVFQDFTLLSVSILENILMRPVTDKEKDEELAWEALKKVGLYDKVKNLPEGIYTKYSNEFDEHGVFFSGGEKQSLAIARIYAQKSSVVILDEPYSALDPIAEQNVYEKTLKYMQDKIVILITHRLSNVKNADCIFYMENGVIMEKGTHDSLMKIKGKYFQMYTAQNQENEE